MAQLSFSKELAMKIVPSILAESFDDFTARLRVAESFADYVQIDIMDGIFVETKSFSVEEINAVNTSLAFEMHLMVADPLSLLSKIRHPGLKKVIFHFEAETDRNTLIGEIRTRGLAAGMAVRPETALDRIGEAAQRVDSLLFLTVDPCCYGSPFKPEVLEKVARARTFFPGKEISVDGGVSLDNLRLFRNLGVDSVCVGSRIFLNGDPRENYRHFIRKVKEMEGG